MGPPTYCCSNISVMGCFFSTFPTKVIVQNGANKTTSLAWGTFISKHRRYRCQTDQTIIPVRQRISNIFLYVSISPINHHMKRFFGFDALRVNICQKAFCERIMLSQDVSPRFIKNIITWWKFYISFQWPLKWNRYFTWFS